MKSIFLISLLLLFGQRVLCAEREVVWGEPVNGISLGLFFPKDKFIQSEAVTAIVIVRNDSVEMRSLLNSPLLARNDLFEIFASGQNRKQIPQKSRAVVGGYSGGMYPLLPGRTVAYEFDLRDFLIINGPDELVITAKRFLADKTGRYEVLSGNASVRITAVDSPTSARPLPTEIQSALDAGKPKYGGGATASPTQTDSAIGQPSPLVSPTEQSGAESGAVLLPKTSPPNGTSGGLASRTSAASQSAGVPPLQATSHFTPSRKVGAGIMAALVALLLAILWRAARRKRV